MPESIESRTNRAISSVRFPFHKLRVVNIRHSNKSKRHFNERERVTSQLMVKQTPLFPSSKVIFGVAIHTKKLN